MQLRQAGGGNVGGAEPFLQQTRQQMLLLLKFAAFERHTHFLEKYIVPRLFHFVGGGDFGAGNTGICITLDHPDLEKLAA